MKILFEVEDRVRKDSTCVYFKKAFQKLADVTVVYPEQLPQVQSGIFDLHIRVDYGIDTPFPIDLHPSVYYAIDTHIDLDWRLNMVKKAKFDYVFCAQHQGMQHDWGTEKKYWLPLACDPETHSIDLKYKKLHDICFIGNCQPFWQQRRVERLDKLFKAIPDFYYGNLFFNEASKKYAESRLVFNSAHSTDINMRVFEAMASGSCLLTDKQDWKDLFIPNHHFIEYQNDEDMIEKAKYYLKHEDEREAIAINGKREVLEKHTYLDRAKAILKVCGF